MPDDLRRELREIHETAVCRYRAGATDAGSLFEAPADKERIRRLGLGVQVVFDFIEDFAAGGTPTVQDFIDAALLRVEWFQRDLPAGMARIPGREATGRGIRWLPRITAKARRFLAGTLPEDLMFGCGGDRAFLQAHRLTIGRFLAEVSTTQDDDLVFAWVASGKR